MFRLSSSIKAGFKSLRHIYDLPRGTRPQEFGHQRGVKNVAAPLSPEASQERHSQQRQIADDVQNLVAHKLIPKAQRRVVHHSFGREHDGIIE